MDNAHFWASTSTSFSAYWLSDNGNFTFGFKSLGSQQYLLCIWMTADANKTPLWWPPIDNNPILSQDGAILIFTQNGNLELSNGNLQIIWNAPTLSASFARLQNNGNLQLLDVTRENILWQSFIDRRDTLIVNPREDDSSYPLTSLLINKTVLLQSQSNYVSGRFHLMIDEYPNVSLHAFDSARNVDFVYAFAQLNVTEDFLGLTGEEGKIYEVNSSMSTTLLRLDSDGNLRFYVWNTLLSTWNKTWQLIDNKCLIGSPCGAYGICKENIDGSLGCTCPTGYKALDPHSNSLGCNSSFSLINACNKSGGNNRDGLFHMAENKQSDYYSFNDMTQRNGTDIEGCKKLCLDDCHCIAASYRTSDETCVLMMGNQNTSLLMNGYYKDGSTVLMKVLVSTGNGRVKIVWVGVVIAMVVMVIAIGIISRWLKRNRGHGCEPMMFGKSRGFEYRVMMGDGGPIKFTYHQLVEATQNFSELLGEGGFGRVYKGRIIVIVDKGGNAREKRLPVAVKVLKSSRGGGHAEAEKQFKAEVSTLGKIHHINLVSLLGYCIRERAQEKSILVYEYLENGSLSKFLSEEAKPPLSWEARYSIALGTARGIAYLHHECTPQILHCDIKPQNVLLNRDFMVKVADFGLARQFEEVNSHLTMSCIRGTRGYMAPEWLKTVEITSKADVYSYGMVLLELVRGFLERGDDGESLVDWAYQFISSNQDGEHKEPSISNGEGDPVVNLLEPDKLKEGIEKTRVLKIGLWCVQYQPQLRPSMLRILQLLEGSDMEVKIPPYPSSRLALECNEDYSTSTSINSYISAR